MLRRRGKGLVTFAQHAFAHEFALTAQGFSGDTSLFFRRFLVRTAQLHLAEDALALHLFLEHAQSLIDIAVADGDRNDGMFPFFSNITPR